MKIYAGDQDKQIYDYYNFLNNKVEKINSQKVMIYYLTLDGKEPSKESLDGLDKHYYQNISFEKEILQWLEKCQYEVQNITNLNEAIKQYTDVVKMVTNKYEGKVMGLKQFLLKDENLKLMLGDEMQQALNESKIEVEKKFWEQLKDIFNNQGYKFNYVDYKLEIKSDLNTKIRNQNIYYGLACKLMDIDDKYALHLYIEKEPNITYGLTISENDIRKPISKDKQFLEYLNKTANLCDWTTNTKDKDNHWWLHWNYPKNKLNFREFTSDSIFKFIDDIYNNGDNKIIDQLSNEIIALIVKFKTT